MKSKNDSSKRAEIASARASRKEAANKVAAAEAARESAIANALHKRRDGADVSTAWMEEPLRIVLRAKAPRLLDVAYRDPIRRLASYTGLRAWESWSPRGKSARTLFRSLAAHRLARYPVPAIVWNAFDDAYATLLVPLAAHVAAGHSFYEWARTRLPIPLTRKMCHAILNVPCDHGLLDAIRLVQAQAAGCSRTTYDAWKVTRVASAIGSAEDEAHWQSVLEWFAKAPMLEGAKIGPLVDYIEARRRETPSFSMKGRSAPALLRAMEEWHAELRQRRAITGKTFVTSGFARGESVEARKEADGSVVKELWTIEEILTDRTLAEEGRNMSHCVYSYGWRIEKGDTSIWSVKMEDGCGATGRWHMVTLEVRNDLRRVVQARGRHNRSMTNKEHRVVAAWARRNGLAITLGAW